MKFKCRTCFTIVDEQPCPVCGEIVLEPMCELDTIHCCHAVVAGIKHCPKCGQPICPVEGCFSHDVSQISRVTGYMADVSGWSNGKRQELRDRHRYDNFE